MRSAERSVSIWEATEPQRTTEPLREDAEADVCVVGAGIAGLSAAHELAREGRRVVVLESAAVGAGETGQTTAHLSAVMDAGFARLERLHGPEGLRRAVASHAAALERIGEVAAEEGIACDYARVDGWLVLAPGTDPAELDREHAAAERVGMEVERAASLPLPSWDGGPCLRFPGQARVHPLKYLRGLADAVERRGGRVHTGTHVDSVEGGDPATVRTRGRRTVRAGAVVVATNAPISDRLMTHAKQSPWRTYAVAMRLEGEVPDALFWDTADPYHYVRLQPVGEGTERRMVLIVGGEDHPTGGTTDAERRYAALEAWARERFPAGAVERRWSGQWMEPVDGLAQIGPVPLEGANVHVVTGDAGQGITHGALAGMLLRDRVLGRDNPWATLYDPGRVPVRAAKEWARAGAHMARHYAEWVAGSESEAESEAAVAPGSGAVVREGSRPVAVHRAEDGTVTRRSAVCTHLGCIVHWNGEERSWDCPCHGSRFAPDGTVLNGPAASPLPPVEEG